MAFWILQGYDVWSLAFVALACYVSLEGIRRLYFSPLSKFPGPKLAAITLWYEFYYDVVLRGQYIFHIRDLHAQYGPIIRINPYELHISDPEYIDKLYVSSASGEKRDKWEWYTKQFGTPGAMFSTTPHDHHKARRAALNNFFSMSSVRKLQPLVEERVQQLVERLRTSSEVVTLNLAYAAFTNDVIMEYSYGRSDHRLEAKDFDPSYHDTIVAAGKQGHLLKQWIWILYFIQSLPESLAARLSPDLDLVIRLARRVKKQIIEIKAKPKDTYQDLANPTLFHEILQSNLQDVDKSTQRLTDEAQIIVGAGTATTAWAISVATYHLLTTPKILEKLKTELRSAVPDPNVSVPLSVLMQLPYLSAVIQEALRLSYGTATRLQRISPDKVMLFTDSQSKKTWAIPTGTPVSMTSVLIHHDGSIFPDSRAYRPERWIENPRLDKYLVAFSKGSRQCLGINLAYAEMYLCLSNIFRRFGSGGKQGLMLKGDEGVLELYETKLSDVEIESDGFVPLMKEGTKGIRVKVVKT